MLLMIRTTVDPPCVSGGTLIIANCGLISIGFQTVPLIYNTVVGCVLSFESTLTIFVIGVLKLAVLTWIGISPVFPGSTFFVQSPAVVQPHPGRTLLTSSVS